MKKLAMAAAVLAAGCAATGWAQATGVSRPEAVPVTTSPEGVQQPVVYDEQAPAPAAPALRDRQAMAQGTAAEQRTSAPAPVVRSATEQREVAALEHPAAAASAGPGVDERDDAAAAVAARRSDRRASFLNGANGPSEQDGQIVIRVPGAANELPEGTLLKASVREPLNTYSTHIGQEFHAELQQDVERDGRVLLPAGSVLTGRVTDVHGGRRISGAASIHLEPLRVTLPDGTEYALRAHVIDTDLYREHKVDDEGTIIRKDHAKERLAVGALTTGSAAATGGVIAGPAGALVGAGIGAGVNTVMWLKADRQMELPAGMKVVFSLSKPLAVGRE